jgi:hypothetical protein
MDTRADWDIALRHEEARVARYGRPAAVLAVRLRVPTSSVLDNYAQRVGEAIRQQARETDRVTRVSQDRFQVLLPETVEAEATVLADRVRTACIALMPGLPASELEIVVAAASTSTGGTLHEALRTVHARTDG